MYIYCLYKVGYEILKINLQDSMKQLPLERSSAVVIIILIIILYVHTKRAVCTVHTGVQACVHVCECTTYVAYKG